MFKTLNTLMLSVFLLVIPTTTWASTVLDYRLGISEDGKRYEIFMKPESTPFADFSLTGQVTIKVPHHKGNHAFRAVRVKSHIDKISWIESSRVDAPEESPSFDYISFIYLAMNADRLYPFGWEANKEQLVFSFENHLGCVEGVSLIENTDPFNQQPNSANTQPGNQFTNLGWGRVSDNNYQKNYGESPTCSVNQS